MKPFRKSALIIAFSLGCHKASPALTEATSAAPPASSAFTGAPSAAPAAASALAGAASAASPALSPASSARPHRLVVREKAKVVVDGKDEAWRLEWTDPRPAGIPGTDLLYPVTGRFGAFGETGQLAVVRERPGAAPERLELGEIALARWPARPDDGDMMPAATVTARPELPAFHLGDYDHDGNAAEFPLIVKILSPGTFGEDRRTVLVGLDRKTRRLAILGDARWPDKPTTMTGWEPLRRANPAEVIQSACGEHGYSTEKTYVVSADGEGLHVKERRYDCLAVGSKGPSRGRRLGEQEWTPDKEGIHGTYPNYFEPAPPEDAEAP